MKLDEILRVYSKSISFCLKKIELSLLQLKELFLQSKEICFINFIAIFFQE